MIAVHEAVAMVMQHAETLPEETVTFTDCLGRYLAQDVYAKEPLPPFPASIKDGYAVIAADGAGKRQVMGDSSAGDAPDQTLSRGQCIRINTGAPVAAGADAVVQVEDTILVHASEDGTAELEIEVMRAPTVGQDIRACANVSYIPVVSSGSKTSDELSLVKQEMSDSLTAINTMQMSVQKCQAAADVDNKKHLRSIQEHTDRLIQHARSLEKTAIDDVNKHHKETKDALASEIASLTEAKTMINTRLKKLDNALSSSDDQVFIDLKMGTREVESVRQLEQRFQSTDAEHTRSTFVVDENVDTFVREVSSLGKVAVQKPFKCTFDDAHNVAVKGEEYHSDICDVSEMSNWKILMTDAANISIKIVDLDQSSGKVKSFPMPSMPWGVCQINENEIAVTLLLDKKVQFVNVNGEWELTTSFTTEDRCRGIAHSRGELIVACGGGPGGDGYAPEGPGFVGIYDKLGSRLRKFQLDEHGKKILSLPRSIAITNSGKHIHVADEIGGAITFNLMGKVLSTFRTNMNVVVGLTALENDTLVVCGARSNNIVQLNTDGEFVAEILSKHDGIEGPRSVFFSASKSMLIVAIYDSNDINVYTLHS